MSACWSSGGIESVPVPVADRLNCPAIAEGAVRDQAELAELGYVTRARVTQIMNLLHLAPDIQEALLFLPRTEHGRDPICERRLRAIAAESNWRRQRQMWEGIGKAAFR